MSSRWRHKIAAENDGDAILDLQIMKISEFSLPVENLAHWGGGVEGVITPGLSFFWGEGAPELIAPLAHRRCMLWECSSELYMYVSSIERLDTTFWNVVLKILAKFVIFFSIFSFSS